MQIGLGIGRLGILNPTSSFMFGSVLSPGLPTQRRARSTRKPTVAMEPVAKRLRLLDGKISCPKKPSLPTDEELLYGTARSVKSYMSAKAIQ